MDETGSLIQHYTYSSFGKILRIVDNSGNDITANPIVKTSYGFTNREHDSESGLMYYRARYYMPGIGRFIEEDPHPGRLSSPGSVTNKYIYVLNSPTSLVDPEGKFGVIAGILLAGTIGGGLNMAMTGNWDLATFISGFESAAIASTVVVTGAYLGAFIASGSLTAALAGGTKATFLGATIGGALAGAYWGWETTRTIEGAVLGLIGGAFTGAALGAYGFGLTPSKNGQENVLNSVNDLNRGTSTNLVPQKCHVVPGSEGFSWKCDP